MKKESKHFSSLISRSLSILAVRGATIFAIFFIFIFYSHRLSKYDYGVYTSFFVNASIITGIASLGIQSVALNFSKEKLIHFIKTVSPVKWALLIFWIILVSVISYVILYLNQGYGLIFILFFALLSTCFLMDNVLLVLRNYSIQFLINLFYAGALVWLHISNIFFDGTFYLQDLVLMWTIALVGKLLVQISFVIYERNKAIMSSDPLIFPKKSTWWLLGFYESFQLIVRQADKAIFFLLFPKEMGASYFNGRIDIPFLPAILSSVRSSALLNLAEMDQKQGSKPIMHSTFRILSIIGISIFFFGIAYSKELFTVVFSEKYIDAVDYFIISLFLIPAQFCLSPVFMLQYKERIDIINYGAFIDLVLSILLSFILFPLLKNYAIITAIVVSTFIQSFYYLVIVSKTLKESWVHLIPIQFYVFLSVIMGFLAFTSHYLFSKIFNISDVWIVILGVIIGILSVVFTFLFQKNGPKENI